jgi:tRNA threonylcarbamoyladenosine biosynthesis protein TsaB
MSAMRILALETSTESGSCALWCDGAVLQRLCPTGRSHSETLLPLVRELLAEAGLSIAQLDGIAFGVGPGAFTGLRVACGAAQGLAVAADLPLLPVTSLEAMAASCAEECGAEVTEVLALLDARMGEVYAGVYGRPAKSWELQGSIRVMSPAALSLPEKSSAALACGNALLAYPELAVRVAASGYQSFPDILPQAAWLVRLAAPRLAAGEGIDPALAAPLYIRDKVAKTVAERLQEGGRA